MIGDMMNITLINAKTDLGVTVDGSNLGPKIISDHFKSDTRINKIIDVNKPDIIKSKAINDRAKNLDAVNTFNENLYNAVKATIKDGSFPIILGGDHSLAIASALGTIEKSEKLGIIWIDAHLDYNTFETTITGNLHGLPLATINGLNKDLSSFHKGIYYDPKHAVVIGYRSEEENKEIELNNIKKMGVTVFTTEDIRKIGIKNIIKKAFEIASSNTKGVHISYDLDVIDPKVAPGVSVPEENGITSQEAIQIIKEVLKYKNIINSLDLIEFNPLNDINKQTENLALNILEEIIKAKSSN